MKPRALRANPGLPAVIREIKSVAFWRGFLGSLTFCLALISLAWSAWLYSTDPQRSLLHLVAGWMLNESSRRLDRDGEYLRGKGGMRT